MRRGMAFADVLDETLAVYRTTEGLAVPPPAAFTYARPLGFFAFGVVKPQPASGGLAIDAVSAPTPRIAATAQAQTQAQAPQRVAARPQPQQPRYSRASRPSARALSPRHRRALLRLVELGADISTDFTAEELRSAYRGLARRYHPDHHPQTSDAEKRQLAYLFTQARDSYAELQALATAA
jgi:hypothetical protein